MVPEARDGPVVAVPQPRGLLTAVTTNVTGIDPDSVRTDSSISTGPTRVAVTGEPWSTRAELEDDELGRGYRRDGAYYTVVGTAETRVDRPLLSRVLRGPLGFLGVVAWLVAGRLLWPEDVRRF